MDDERQNIDQKIDSRKERGLRPAIAEATADDAGLLVKTHFNGIETQRSEFEDFAGARIARRIDVLKDEVLGMRIRITEISHEDAVPATSFVIPKHEWTRAFTDEVR